MRGTARPPGLAVKFFAGDYSKCTSTRHLMMRWSECLEKFYYGQVGHHENPHRVEIQQSSQVRKIEKPFTVPLNLSAPPFHRRWCCLHVAPVYDECPGLSHSLPNFLLFLWDKRSACRDVAFELFLPRANVDYIQDLDQPSIEHFRGISTVIRLPIYPDKKSKGRRMTQLIFSDRPLIGLPIMKTIGSSANRKVQLAEKSPYPHYCLSACYRHEDTLRSMFIATSEDPGSLKEASIAELSNTIEKWESGCMRRLRDGLVIARVDWCWSALRSQKSCHCPN